MAKAVESGFKWNTPTRNGMLWHTFDTCGVYYYSDLGDEECASYIGIIAVKQKSENHVLAYDEENKNFGIGTKKILIFQSKFSH